MHTEHYCLLFLNTGLHVSLLRRRHPGMYGHPILSVDMTQVADSAGTFAAVAGMTIVPDTINLPGASALRHVAMLLAVSCQTVITLSQGIATQP